MRIIKGFFKFILKLVAVICILGVIGGASGIYLAYNYSENLLGMPIDTVYHRAQSVIAASDEGDFRLNQTSYIYDTDGNLMTKLSAGSSQNYTYFKDIPKDVINAFISTEDKTFWENPGFELKAIVRAGYAYLRTGEFTQGGSTITQQLVKLTFLSSEKTISRKVNEIFMAYFVTEKYSKEQIMEWYINRCCFANGIYGIADAAYAYLGKELDDLTIGEIAYLCAIPNSPEYYNPWIYPENAVTRMKLILANMYEDKYITEEEYEQALKSEINLQHNTINSDYDDMVSYAIYCATEYLMKQNGFVFKNEFGTSYEYESYWNNYNEAYAVAKNMLYSCGYQIYTSLDPETQEAVQQYLDEELKFDSEVDEDGIYNLQGSVTVVDNNSHKVTAIIGGRSQEERDSSYGINRAFQVTRQPGSSIKPLLVYGPAVDNGYTKDSVLYNIDVQTAYEYYNDKDKSVESLTGKAYPLATAVQQSYNGCAVYLYNKITPAVGLSYIYQLGFCHITSDDQYLSAALGGLTYGTNTLEMAGAYSTFPSYGEYTKPDCLVSIIDSEGKEIYKQTRSVTVFKRNTAIQMAEILEGPVKSGTAKSMKWYSYTDIVAAGKTGTTQKNADGWFCGFTDQYTVAVWVGSNDNTSVAGMQGGTYPAEIWRDTMLWLLENKPVEVEESIFDAEVDYGNDDVISSLTNELAESGEVWYVAQAGNVRSGPGTEYETLFAVSAGRAVVIIEMQQYWTEIYQNVRGKTPTDVSRSGMKAHLLFF